MVTGEGVKKGDALTTGQRAVSMSGVFNWRGRAGRSELTTTILSDAQVRDLVEKMLKSSGRRIDMSSPFAQPSQQVQAHGVSPVRAQSYPEGRACRR